MSKWCGMIGFADGQMEIQPGIWQEQVIEKRYYGDQYRNTRLLQSSGGINGNINIGNQISIIADPYANHNFHSIRYVEFMGSKWKVTNVEVQYPRLILTIGGLVANVQ